MRHLSVNMTNSMLKMQAVSSVNQLLTFLQPLTSWYLKYAWGL